MTDVLYQYLLFALKTCTVAGAIIAVVILSRSGRGGKGHRGRLAVRRLNHRYRSFARALHGAALTGKELKRWSRQERERRREEVRNRGTGQRKRLFVLDFRGDIRASAVASLRHEVTAISTVAGPSDEVVLRLTSSGGVMHSYGLAASQLVRLKDQGIGLTVAVDQVAASGGYLMACVAHRIVAAPFAILGSIGVVAQVPNIHRLLKENAIDVEQHTAGKYKRTLSLVGENTDEMREKFKEDLQEAHLLFQQFVGEHRPSLDIPRVATGEHWFGRQAHALGLVDELITSDDLLLSASGDADIYEVSYQPKGVLGRRVASGLGRAFEALGLVFPRSIH